MWMSPSRCALAKRGSSVLLKERRINDYNELRDKVLQSRYPQGIYQMSELVEFIDISESQTLAEKIKQGKIINEQLNN